MSESLPQMGTLGTLCFARRAAYRVFAEFLKRVQKPNGSLDHAIGCSLFHFAKNGEVRLPRFSIPYTTPS